MKLARAHRFLNEWDSMNKKQKYKDGAEDFSNEPKVSFFSGFLLFCKKLLSF